LPNIKSAAKRVEIARKRNQRNSALKSTVKTAIKKFEATLGDGNQEATKTALVKAIKTIDSAVTKGLLHKNNAARKKSRLQRRFNATIS